MRNRVGICLFFGTLLVYVATANGYVDAPDGEASYRAARSLVLHGSFDVRAEGRESPLELAPVGRDGRRYAQFGLGAALELTPPVLVGYLVPGSVELRDRLARAVASAQHALWGAAGVLLVYLLSLMYGVTPRSALLAALVLAFGSHWWFFSNSTYSEAVQGTSLLAAAALTSSVVLSAGTRARHLSWLAGVTWAWLVLVKLANVPGAVVAILVAWWLKRRTGAAGMRPVARMVLPLAVALLAIALFDVARFGSVWETGYGAHATAMSLALIPHNLVFFIVDPRAGLLLFAPLLLLGIVGYIRTSGSPRWRVWHTIAGASGLAIAAVYLASRLAGEQHFGARFAVTLLPLLAMGLGRVFDQFRGAPLRAWVLVCTVAIASFSLAVNASGALVNPNEYRNILWRATEMQEAPISQPVWLASMKLTVWKLQGRPPVFQDGDMGLRLGRPVDLSEFEAFRGFDTWSAHGARELGIPALAHLGWIPVVLGVALLACAVRGLPAAARTREVEC